MSYLAIWPFFPAFLDFGVIITQILLPKPCEVPNPCNKKQSLLCLLFSPLALHRDKRHKHFLHRDATMLESVLVITDVVVVVVRIGKEVVVLCKDVGCAEVLGWQESLVRPLQFIDLLGIVREVFAQFVTQVGIGVAVANDLDRVVHTDAAVVGSNDDMSIGLCQFTEEVADGGVVEPGGGDAAVGTLVAGEFAHHA